MELADRQSLIRIRLQMLMAVFGKRVAEEHEGAFYEVYLRNLQNYPQEAISRGFTIAEQSLERFPTPKVMREICNSQMPSRTWQMDFKPGKDRNGTPCLIDPDPLCDKCREPHSAHPTKQCREAINEREAQFMYRPQDCPEGREFLRKLRELAGRK